MSSDALTLTDLATVATIAAGVFAVLNTSLRWLMDYLQAKFGGPTAAQSARYQQSEQCRFDHANVNTLITAQNATISKMLEQNGRMIDAMKDASHVSELRHQIILGQLKELGYKVTARRD